LESLNDSEDVIRPLVNIKEIIKISATESLGLYELKQHKPWFDEDCSHFSGKQAKKCSGNVNILNTVRLKGSRLVGNKKREHLKVKLTNLKQTIITKIPETCRGASVRLRWVTLLKQI